MKKILLLTALLCTINLTFSQVDKADMLIKNLMQKNRITGLQLAVVKNNTIVKTSNYGLANLQDSIAVDNKTVFSINSITKSFTGVAIMQLVENGKLNLEDPISKHLDSLPTTWQNITIKQIATHTSGIPDIWDSQGNILSENSEALLKKIKELPVAFKPGEELRYNQTNFLLLGMIIEKVSKKSFENFIKENQFEKAGMKNSIKAGFGDFYNIINHTARPYSYFRNGVLNNVYQPMPSILYPAGGIYSTATEIAQWVIALQSHKLINAESLKMLLKPIELNNGKVYETNDFLNISSIGFSIASREKKNSNCFAGWCQKCFVHLS
ncbi:serine hydrolase [Flavobacterium sp. H122]|uniref:serine hydrolase domain-containing protein n=1 Tax=Flavobacterium sp. H122 TaxID=2529860 RepID=UPI0010AB1FD4|nr:serine hydrolase domain-containing protein [Flavobacterium sp. H122]